MFSIYAIITNNGDGSNSLMWVDNKETLDYADSLNMKGYETFTSGDGLQVNTFKFKTHNALTEFVELNQIDFETVETLNEYLY